MTRRMTATAAAPITRRVAVRGEAILTSPRWNKGTAFSIEERKAFGLTGRLPFRVNSLDEQCDRAYDQLESRDTPLRKNTFLQSLKDQNWVLYYALLSRHSTELIPIIYTPTEVRISRIPTALIWNSPCFSGGCNLELLPSVPQKRGPVSDFPHTIVNGRRLSRADERPTN